MHNTNYHNVGTAAEAAALIANTEDGALLAGGQTLLPTMKARLAAPVRSRRYLQGGRVARNFNCKRCCHNRCHDNPCRGWRAIPICNPLSRPCVR